VARVAVRLAPPATWGVLAVLCAAQFVLILDVAVVNMALVAGLGVVEADGSPRAGGGPPGRGAAGWGGPAAAGPARRRPLGPERADPVAGGPCTKAVTVLMSAIVLGMNFFLTVHIQDRLGFSPIAAGLAFLPVTVISALTSTATGRAVTQAAGCLPGCPAASIGPATATSRP
jgi:hypothetical protein